MAWVMGAVTFGASLLGHEEQKDSAKFGKRLSGAAERINRRVIEIRAREDTEDRQRRLQSTLSSQRAAMGAMGIAGGRTARLFELQARSAAGREQFAADIATTTQLAQSQLRQLGSIADFSAQVAQSQVDLLTTGIRAFQTAQATSGTQQASASVGSTT